MLKCICLYIHMVILFSQLARDVYTQRRENRQAFGTAGINWNNNTGWLTQHLTSHDPNSMCNSICKNSKLQTQEALEWSGHHLINTKCFNYRLNQAAHCVNLTDALSGSLQYQKPTNNCNLIAAGLLPTSARSSSS